MNSIYKQSNLLEQPLGLPEKVLFILAASELYYVPLQKETKHVMIFHSKFHL